MIGGRTAIVTGASRGLGREVALQLTAAGAATILVARTESTLSEVADECRNAGGEAVAVVGDLSSPDGVDDVLRKIGATGLAPTILVNNAGAAGPFGPLWELSTDEWDGYLHLNLVAPVHLSASVIPVMIEDGWGRIVNVTSSASQHGLERTGAYSIAKAGLNMLTRQLALELQDHPQIAVTSFAPGPMDTAAYADLLRQPRETVGDRNFMRFRSTADQRRLGAVAGPASVIVNILTEPSNRLSGEYIDISDDYARGTSE